MYKLPLIFQVMVIFREGKVLEKVFSQCPSRSAVRIMLVSSVSLPGRTNAGVIIQVPKCAKY